MAVRADASGESSTTSTSTPTPSWESALWTARTTLSGRRKVGTTTETFSTRLDNRCVEGCATVHFMTNWTRRALAAALLVALAFATAVAARSFAAALADFRPRRDAIPAPDLPDLRQAVFSSGTASIHGWAAPPRNGASIVLLHGSGADRRQMLPQAR